MKAKVSILLLPVLTITGGLFAWTALSVKDDPLIRMPGTQPEQTALESPGRCLNCHGGYNSSVEPGFNWKGSMMAQAARDPIFWACFTVALQDSIWAVGTPNAGDICERCHFPPGWLEGRSDPPNASAMIGSDYDAIHCDFCHRMYDPFFEATYDGTREGSDWLSYWDETNQSDTPSQTWAHDTYLQDLAESETVVMFNGQPFYAADNLPVSPDYTENASGQYFISADSAKRSSFADAEARHQMLYSRYHKSKYFCATCHDVSNPILANLGADANLPLPTETYSAHSYYHVERTFSEFMLSAYGQAGGSAGIGPFAPDLYDTSNTDNVINKCQDCHMRDVVGAGCNKKGVPIRPYDSVEHPNSGLPLHDLTGGNAWISNILASIVPGSPNYDQTNYDLLQQGPAVLTLDFTQGEPLDAEALLAGSERAKQQLQLAAAIEELSYNPSNGNISFRVRNQTGHKLISGFPEGRRMFVNIKAYAGDTLVYEVNPYDYNVGTLAGLNPAYSPNSPPLEPGQVHADELVYETHPKSALTGEDETFHFALATDRYKDNRIPPKGFRISEAADRLSRPVWHGVIAPDLFTADEYAGGYDDVSLNIAAGADYVEVTLYYQGTSREYIQFLKDEINGDADTLSSPTPSGEPQAYIIQTDPFFSQLREWGNVIWGLWYHNHGLDGGGVEVDAILPFEMTEASWGQEPAGCGAPAPQLVSAEPGNQQVTLTWSDENLVDSNVVGYRVYYDQSGKTQFIAEVGLTTTYTDTALTNGQEYCYKVTSLYADCESEFSAIFCAIPNNQGHAGVTVNDLLTGRYETTGKGKNKTIVFVTTDTFNVGDQVVIRAYVVDESTRLPLANAAVTIDITGPENRSLNATSDADGIAEAAWQTQAPNRRGQGGTTPGAYTATVTAVAADGYTWDGQMTAGPFTLQ
ncbi:MAG: fibronectin type III domain-containing protein [Planctomycetota bacterium]|jgi:hypothetical protein